MNTSVSVAKAGLLTLNITSNDQIMNIDEHLPKQTLYLKNVRVQMTSDAVALSTGIIYINCDLFGNGTLINKRTSRFDFPILLQGSAVSLYHCDIPIEMEHSLKPRFNVKILNEAGALLPDFVSCQLQFNYDISLST